MQQESILRQHSRLPQQPLLAAKATAEVAINANAAAILIVVDFMEDSVSVSVGKIEEFPAAQSGGVHTLVVRSGKGAWARSGMSCTGFQAEAWAGGWGMAGMPAFMHPRWMHWMTPQSSSGQHERTWVADA
jgi:hypothetical protein